MHLRKHRFTSLLAVGVLCWAQTALLQAADANANANGTYLPKTGTKAPARYNGTGLTEKQMGAANLPAPEPGNKWVQIGDKFVQMKTSDGTVQAVEPSVK